MATKPKLTIWPRETENRPFVVAAFNRLMNWLNGDVYAAATIKDYGDVNLVQIDPVNSTVTLADLATFDTTDGVWLANGVWLLARNAADSGYVHLIRANTSDIIELGETTARLSFLSPLTNNTPLYGRNAANSASVLLVNLNASDIIELGATTARLSILSPITNNTALGFRNAANSATVAGLLLNASNYFELGAAATRITISSPLTNNTKLTASNAANSAAIALIGVNASDQIDVGVSGTRTNLLGTVVAPSIDPPTVAGQVTAVSQCKAYAFIASGGSMGTGNYNIDTVTYNSAGDYTVAWDRDFAGAFHYGVQVTIYDNTGTVLIAKVNSQTASSADIHIKSAAGVKTDPVAFAVAAFGILS